MPVTKTNYEDVLTYHAPDERQLKEIAAVREAAKWFVAAILDNTPICADQQAALRHVREALMTANAAIVLRGQV